MFLLSILLTTWLAIFQFADSASPEIESIEPVNLNYFCVHDKKPGIHLPKSPVLLIHGLGSSLTEWDGFYQNLTRRTNRRVCVIDLRNHGDSPWNNRTDIAALTADVENFLNQRRITHINILGHSLGGKIAVDYTLKYPSKVSSLVVEDMRPNGITDEALGFVRQVTALYQQVINEVPDGSSEEEAKQIIMDAVRQKFADVGVNRTISEDQIQIRQVNGKWQFKFNLELIAKALENPEQFLTTSTGCYFGPTLFIYGTTSPFDIKGDEDNIIELFPNAKLIPVQGAGHGIHGNYIQFEDEVVKLYNGM